MQWTVTDDIRSETWRRLLEFCNQELVIEELIRRHGTPPNDSARNNYKKQAVQARVCALQAKEYFDAARASSLFTSPNHAYYGAVALASLSLLILGKGTSSLDYLRRDSRNNHHGLNLTFSCDAKTATEGFRLLESTRAEILDHGHFRNWYSVLPAQGRAYANVTRIHNKRQVKNFSKYGEYEPPKLHTLIGRKFSLVDLIKTLPDLDKELYRFGIAVPRSRTNYEVTINYDKNQAKHIWRLHGCPSVADLEALLEKFTINARFADSLNFTQGVNENAGIVTLDLNFSDDMGPLEVGWPTSRETMNHESISYATIDENHEIVDLYLISYQLSMLSRYYPDIWIRFIESRCKGALLVERATELLIKKLPILALSLLSTDDVFISTHRQPWYD